MLKIDWSIALGVWQKYNDWSNSAYYFRNGLTFERIPLTEAQYDDNDYTIERAMQT